MHGWTRETHESCGAQAFEHGGLRTPHQARADFEDDWLAAELKVDSQLNQRRESIDEPGDIGLFP